MNRHSIPTAASLIAATFSVTLLLGACGRGSDPVAVEVLTRSVPSEVDGTLYVTVTTDGSCRTDCPPPGVSRGWVVDCANIETAQQSLVAALEADGFAADGDQFTSTVDGFDLTVNVSTYTDASSGPTPTEEPFISDPGLLSGACSLFVAGQVNP